MEENKKYTEEECHKKFAIDLNNLVWGLLSKEDRNLEENDRMINAAHASLFYWSKVGTEVNLQRGEWLISHVYAVLGRGEPALYHAKKCMKITEEEDLKDFDLAYAYEGLARALAVSGDKRESRKYIELAEEAGEEIEAKEDRELFFSDFKNGPWYGVKSD